MKKLSLQWRITLMTALLICSTCMAMNWLIGCSGRHYMDSIGTNLSTAIDPSEGAVEYFDPSREGLDPNLTIVIYGAQNSFTATNWYITAAVAVRERASKDSGPQWSTTSFWVNCRRVRLRMRASRSSK